MAAYTWTFVRIDKLTPEMVKTCIGHAKWRAEGYTYYEYMSMKFKDALKDWIESHKESYDYYVNVCGIPPEKMTDKYLEKELKKKLKEYKLRFECYDKCLTGEMTVEEMLRKTHQLKYTSDFYVLKRNGYYYIDISHEIFRNYEYCEEEFCTVDALIEHCRKQTGNQFMDYSEKEPEYKKWNQELEDRVRKYYSEIGDNNFYVHFG